MTDPQIQRDDDGPHEGPIRTPKQLILAVVYAFIAPILVIVLLVMYVTSDSRPGAGSTAFDADNVARRIAPIGTVQVKDAADLSTLKSGADVFAAQCTTCHAAGLLGAPKFGDAGAWAPRITTGYPALLNAALHGKGQMPPQGGGDFTDLEIGRAVVYMANRGGAHFDEPASPAAATTTAGAPADTVSPNATPVVTAGATAVTAGTAAMTPGTVAFPASPGTAAFPASSGAAASAVSLASAASPQAAVPAPAATPPSVIRPATPTAAAAPVVAAAAKADAGGAPPALYAQVCQTCHAVGLAGAPKLGDKAAWAPRLPQGIDGLTASAIRGKGAMPPRGGSTASDADIKAVVSYMVGAAK